VTWELKLCDQQTTPICNRSAKDVTSENDGIRHMLHNPSLITVPPTKFQATILQVPHRDACITWTISKFTWRYKVFPRMNTMTGQAQLRGNIIAGWSRSAKMPREAWSPDAGIGLPYPTHTLIVWHYHANPSMLSNTTIWSGCTQLCTACAWH